MKCYLTYICVDIQKDLHNNDSTCFCSVKLRSLDLYDDVLVKQCRSLYTELLMDANTIYKSASDVFSTRQNPLWISSLVVRQHILLKKKGNFYIALIIYLYVWWFLKLCWKCRNLCSDFSPLLFPATCHLIQYITLERYFLSSYQITTYGKINL